MKSAKKTAVKICGIRRIHLLPVLAKEQPEYVGLVFAPGKRQINPETAAVFGRELPSGIRKVGVFMNENVKRMLDLAQRTNLDILQLHGQESPELCHQLRREGYCIWKAFPLKKPGDLYRLQEYQVDGYLLDTAGAAGAGGTGTVFPWHWVTDDPTFHASIQNLILAGGLHPGNIKEAMAKVLPEVVDVSSGVETDGEKNPVLIKEFIQKVRKNHVD